MKSVGCNLGSSRGRETWMRRKSLASIRRRSRPGWRASVCAMRSGRRVIASWSQKVRVKIQRRFPIYIFPGIYNEDSQGNLRIFFGSISHSHGAPSQKRKASQMEVAIVGTELIASLNWDPATSGLDQVEPNKRERRCMDLDAISADANPCSAYSAIHRPTQSLLMSLRRSNPSRSNPGPRTSIFPCQPACW